MKKHIVLLSALLLQAAAVSLFAQDKPKAGDMIRGIVRNTDGPLAGVHIDEIDFYDEYHDSVCSKAVTDENGFFSFEVSDSNNFLMISYIGHETIKVAIDRTEYDITLKGLKNMPKVDVAADSKKVLY